MSHIAYDPHKEKNNCLQMSLANIFSIDPRDVPRFHTMPLSEWKEVMIRWIYSMGYEFQESLLAPTGDRKYIAVGKHGDITHCIVCQSGTMLYDSHRNQGGLDIIKKYWSFHKIPLADESWYELSAILAAQINFTKITGVSQ